MSFMLLSSHSSKQIQSTSNFFDRSIFSSSRKVCSGSAPTHFQELLWVSIVFLNQCKIAWSRRRKVVWLHSSALDTLLLSWNILSRNQQNALHHLPIVLISRSPDQKKTAIKTLGKIPNSCLHFVECITKQIHVREHSLDNRNAYDFFCSEQFKEKTFAQT